MEMARLTGALPPTADRRTLLNASHEAPGLRLMQVNELPKALWSIMFDGASTVKRPLVYPVSVTLAQRLAIPRPAGVRAFHADHHAAKYPTPAPDTCDLRDAPKAL